MLQRRIIYEGNIWLAKSMWLKAAISHYKQYSHIVIYFQYKIQLLSFSLRQVSPFTHAPTFSAPKPVSYSKRTPDKAHSGIRYRPTGVALSGSVVWLFYQKHKLAKHSFHIGVVSISCLSSSIFCQSAFPMLLVCWIAGYLLVHPLSTMSCCKPWRWRLSWMFSY